MGNNSCKTY